MNGECIEWQFKKNAKGYGIVSINGKQMFAHRLAVALSGRTIPKSKVCDHLCRNHSCINPEHIELVSMKENVMRGEAVTAKYARMDSCTKGHKFTEENTRIHTDKKGRATRHCRCCYAHRERQRRKRNKLKKYGK
jgi:hypothetical protein